jgi:hypothetical protein
MFLERSDLQEKKILIEGHGLQRTSRSTPFLFFFCDRSGWLTATRCRGRDAATASLDPSERLLLFFFFCLENDPTGCSARCRFLCRKELHTAADRKKKMKINEGPNEI